MNRLTAPLIVALACVAGAPLAAQPAFTEYGWAMGLHQEFSFSDMAEKILRGLVDNPRPGTNDKQQGQLGLAKIRADQARKAGTVQQRLDLLDEARRLMQDVVDAWPDKGSPAYVDAVFTLVGTLQERGTIAMEAVTEGGQAENEADRLRSVADADFGRAEGLLERLKAQMGDATPEGDRDKWRIKARSFYTLCQLKLNRARIEKPGSSTRSRYLIDASQMLEEYILETEIDDAEAFTGALYGYVLKGQVHEELGEPNDAYASFSSVIDQVQDLWDWKEKLHPSVQDVCEQGYYFLLAFYNKQKKYEDATALGAKMVEQFGKFHMELRLYGRAALVEIAKANHHLGDTNKALALANQVIDSGKDDPAVARANRVIAEIIAGTPDKTQFSPDIIHSAANGAWSGGSNRWGEALRYYRILLQVLPQVPEDQRAAFGAEAYFKIGYYYYYNERWLDAAMVFGEGARKYQGVSENELGANLIRYWPRSLELAYEQTKSEAVKKLVADSQDWRIKNPPPADPGGVQRLLYDKGRGKESDAKRLEDEKKLGEAVEAWREAAKNYDEAVKTGGSYTERAMVKRAACGFKIAELLRDQQQKEEAAAQLRAAKDQLFQYLDFAQNPANVLTDPAQITARATAQAEAKWRISDINLKLAEDAADAGKEPLYREVLKVLERFEETHKDQKSLCVFAIYNRQRANLALGDLAAAEADYRAMRGLDPEAVLTARGGGYVAAALLKPAQTALEKIAGKTDASDAAAWEAAKAKPGFAEARAGVLKAAELYREWLLSSTKAGEDFDNWNAISRYFWEIGEWDKAADLMKRADERFGDRADPKALQWMLHRLLIAEYHLAKEAEARGASPASATAWQEAARVIEKLEKLGFKNLNTLDNQRIVAEILGGYLHREGLVNRWVAALGRYGDAAGKWTEIRRRSEDGSEGWWQATFNLYFTVLMDRKSKNQSFEEVRTGLTTLKAATQGRLGGEKWKPLFEWLERQLN